MLLMLFLRSLLSISDSFFSLSRIFLWIDRVEFTGTVGDVSLPCENGYDLCMEDLAFCLFCLLLSFCASSQWCLVFWPAWLCHRSVLDLEFLKLASRASVSCCFDISTVWLGRLRDILCFVDFHIN